MKKLIFAAAGAAIVMAGIAIICNKIKVDKALKDSEFDELEDNVLDPDASEAEGEPIDSEKSDEETETPDSL